MMLRRLVLLIAWWMLVSSGIGMLRADDSTASTKQRMEQLIEQLGVEDFDTRQQAQDELARFGFAAFDLLEVASTHADLEIATRARYLLRQIRANWSQEDDPPEVKKYLDGYEFQSASERFKRIEGLAELRNVSGLRALCRVVRFEKSTILSKYAALAVLVSEEPYGSFPRESAETIHQNLGKSPRSSAKWLLTNLKMQEDPKKSLPEWKQLVEEEHDLFARSSDNSSSAILIMLLYRLGEYQVEAGEDKAAEESAKRARGLNVGREENRVAAHYRAAMYLRKRGLFRWADLEYRHIINLQPAAAAIMFSMASEMWHDQGQSLRAAKLLDECLEMAKTNKLQMLEVSNTNARRLYFLACHAAEQGDHTKQREYLDEAIKNDPLEIDVLIARYRLKERTPEYHQQTLDLIHKAESDLRKEYQHSGGDAIPLNHFAWLIGNTEGDLDEALRCSQKSLEISGENGAYYDTLGRVYYNRGDFENAVKMQAKAAKLEPHSGLIAKQYTLFRDTLEKQQADKAAPKAE